MTPSMIFTSKSVTAGHPDKLCDQISDAAIDAFLRQNSSAHAIVECAVSAGVIFLAARFAAEANVDLPSLAREVIAEAGYSDSAFRSAPLLNPNKLYGTPVDNAGMAVDRCRRSDDRTPCGSGPSQCIWLCLP